MIKKKCLSICLLAIMFLVSSCSKEAKTPLTTTELTTVQATTEASTQDPHLGEVRSKLTGGWVDKKIGNRRPIAIMINNIKAALPQSGISNAGIVYEVLVEGGITRLLGIFEQYDDLSKIGPVRSARHYYVQVANEYDAVYTHYGQTKYAVSEMNSCGIDTLSGLSSLGEKVFYRDPNRKAPHNAYTSGDKLVYGINQKKYIKKYSDKFEGHFQFLNKGVNLKGGKKASKITLPYSSYTSPYFVYKKDTKTYARYQFGAPQVDDQNQKHLTYRNIIVQFVKEWNIDKNGYQTMELVGSGKGYYISNGSYIPITWNKKSASDITRYYHSNGKEISLNPGKTWVSIFPKDKQSLITFE